METHDDTANSLPRPAGHAPRSNQVHGLAALLRGWWLRTEALDGRCKATVGGPGLLALCHALARAARRPMWVVDGVTCASMDALSRRLRTGWPPRRLVLVDGVVELCDVEAIERAIARGDRPFDAELRTLVDLTVGEDSVAMESIDPEAIDMVAVALLRAHVARCLHVSAGDITEPDLDVVMRVREGADMLLRPIETDIMAGSVDVGLARTGDHPARSSIVFDRETGAWHTR